MEDPVLSYEPTATRRPSEENRLDEVRADSLREWFEEALAEKSAK